MEKRMIKNKVDNYVNRLSSEIKDDIKGQSWLFEERLNKRLELATISELRQKKKVLMIGTAEHSNIGDAAITLAEQEILLKYYPDFYQVEFSTYEMSQEKEQYLYAIANREDIMIMHGGGNLGDMYLDEEKLRRKIIESFPNNRIIIFPQTICFSDTEAGKRELEITKQVYNGHEDLTIFARGKQSFKMAKKYFPSCNVLLFPDVVMFLEQNYNFKREGLIVNLRSDEEGVLKEAQKEEILALLKEEDINYEFCTNMADEDIDRGKRSWVVYNELKKYARSEVVITDRLHGMIFAVITKTPCIVMPTFNHKLIDYYESFLRDSNAIIFLKRYDKKEMKTALDNIRKIDKPIYPIMDKINYKELRNF